MFIYICLYIYMYIYIYVFKLVYKLYMFVLHTYDICLLKMPLLNITVQLRREHTQCSDSDIHLALGLESGVLDVISWPCLRVPSGKLT